MKRCVENLRRYNRPIVCTEYMARPQGSRFDPILGYLKEQHVGAHDWGFVDGKTQTIYPGIRGTKNTRSSRRFGSTIFSGGTGHLTTPTK